ncbi:histidine--tRNA ligase, cytoplasmic, partial [Tanacetum coccineum]
MGYQKYSSLSNNNYRKNEGVGRPGSFAGSKSIGSAGGSGVRLIVQLLLFRLPWLCDFQDLTLVFYRFQGGYTVGSIAAGGCYDNLIGMFGTKRVAGIGVGLGIERILQASETQVLVSILGELG